MASYTTNLNLKKPAGSENVAIGDINNNMDTIDTAYGTLNSNLKVKHNQVQGDTNANGYLISTIPSSTKIISAYAQDYPCVPLTYGGYWYFMVFYPSSGTMIPRSNASTTVHYYYVEY